MPCPSLILQARTQAWEGAGTPGPVPTKSPFRLAGPSPVAASGWLGARAGSPASRFPGKGGAGRAAGAEREAGLVTGRTRASPPRRPCVLHGAPVPSVPAPRPVGGPSLPAWRRRRHGWQGRADAAGRERGAGLAAVYGKVSRRAAGLRAAGQGCLARAGGRRRAWLAEAGGPPGTGGRPLWVCTWAPGRWGEGGEDAQRAGALARAGSLPGPSCVLFVFSSLVDR